MDVDSESQLSQQNEYTRDQLASSSARTICRNTRHRTSFQGVHLFIPRLIHHSGYLNEKMEEKECDERE
jgi:hypothetical protein